MIHSEVFSAISQIIFQKLASSLWLGNFSLNESYVYFLGNNYLSLSWFKLNTYNSIANWTKSLNALSLDFSMRPL